MTQTLSTTGFHQEARQAVQDHRGYWHPFRQGISRDGPAKAYGSLPAHDRPFGCPQSTHTYPALRRRSVELGYLVSQASFRSFPVDLRFPGEVPRLYVHQVVGFSQRGSTMHHGPGTPPSRAPLCQRRPLHFLY